MLILITLFFAIKDTKLFITDVTLSEKDKQKISKRLSKEFERSVYWNEYKTKRENKDTSNEHRYILKSNFAGIKELFAKGIIKNFNVTINGKNFYDKAINFDIKRYMIKIRKLTTRQVKDYIKACLLGYDHIKNHFILIAVDLGRQKEFQQQSSK